MQTFDTKTKIDSSGKPISIGFRYPNGSYKVRSLNKKEFYWIGEHQPGLFGRDRFAAGSHKYVTITEGETDAHSLHQVLHLPVCSVQSANSASADCTADREWCNSFELIYLAFDNDAAGRDALQKVARLFDYNKLRVVKFDRRKDANEYLQFGEDDELRNIFWNSRKYLPETIISSFKEFEKVLKEPEQSRVSYPFPTLNYMTYGIRRGESVLLTAQEGVGKTQLMHAIEHHILKETDDAVGAIYLEEPKKRHLQALAGLELQRPIHLPGNECSDLETIDTLQKLIKKDDRFYLYNHFGSDDPEIFLDTIRFLVSACACFYVFVDHLTMVVSGLSGEDERRALDYISTRLEMMIKELDFALFIVSHVNDEGQTRGSRMISKVCDLRINMKRDLNAIDFDNRNTTFLDISKNRFSGRTGPAGKLLYNPITGSYREELEHGVG